MMKAGVNISFHKLTTHPYSVLGREPGGGKIALDEIPGPETHPVLLAKYLLILATCLQFIHPEFHAEHIRGLSEPPQQLMRRLADTAVNLVNKNDEFLDCIEGLECIMIESTFEANNGHLRRAWLACRRAMLVAQMVGLHRHGIQQPLKMIDPSQPVYPGFFWFRIVTTDRQLCLMLGLPQGSLDTSMASESALAGQTPGGAFEHKQCIIACKILERNESSNPAVLDDLETLYDIDAKLQTAGNEMPSRWWLVPNLASVMHDTEKSFWEVLRLIQQMLYFNLLNLLHLPYMLRSNSPNPAQNEQSRLASVNASREQLTRFIMFRSYNHVAFSCRALDFFALVAGLTLVIAHLNEHRKRRRYQEGPDGQRFGPPPPSNILAYQRNGDRAMIEQVLENMEGLAQRSQDKLSERSAGLLRSLLTLEADAAAAATKVSGREQDNDFAVAAAAMTEMHPDSATGDGESVRIGIPYFGTIRISPAGVVSMETLPRDTASPSLQQHRKLDTSPTLRSPEGTNSTGLSDYAGGIQTISAAQPSPGDRIDSDMAPAPSQPAQASYTSTPLSEIPINQPFAPQFPSVINDALQQQYLYPGLTAGVDDWAFQGVDMAFFDSLIRGSGMENVDGGQDWSSWEEDL